MINLTKFYKIILAISGILASILACAKIGVGVDFQSECSGFANIPYYLYVSGGIELILNILVVALGFYFMKHEATLQLKITSGLSFLILLALNIWGSYIVFSKFYNNYSNILNKRRGTAI